MAIALLILALVALFLAIHPFLTYPLSLAALSKLGVRGRAPIERSMTRSGEPGAASRSEAARTITICLSVYNEERVIDQRIANLLEIARSMPGTRISVYADGSTDGTVEKLRALGDQIDLVVSPARLGKTHGMNLLVARATSDIIVFTDAAVTMGPQALSSMLREFQTHPAVGCVCGRIVAVKGGDDNGFSATASTSKRYWAFDARVRDLETRVASVIGAHGPLFAIRRSLHSPAPVEYFDDFFVSMDILLKGHRVIQSNDFIAYKAVATRRRDEFQRKIRIACQSFHIHRLLVPRLRRQSLLIRYCYASHKTLRWLAIFSLAAATVAGTAWLVAIGLGLYALSAWLLFAATMALGAMHVRPFSAVYEVMSALVANGIGVLQSRRGVVYQTWTPANSARGTLKRET